MSLPSFARATSRTGASLALVAAGILVLAGCSSSDETATTSEPSASSAAGGQQMPERSGISGLIASLSDGLMQVQGADEQNAVSYDDTTTVSETVSGGLDAVTVGSCVVVMGSGSTDATDATDDTDGTVTAESITVYDAVDGECAGGFGGGAPSGEMPEGGDMPESGDMPSGAPADGEMPSGALGGGGMGGIAVGLVTAVDGDTMTVESSFGEETTTSSVVTTSETTVTTTVASDASALEAGRCVTVQGEADDTGTVAATALTVSDAVDGECSTGFGGGFGGQAGAGASDE